MNIQIFGANKCFDTKKAERWFKERRIKYQSIDLVRYGMSGGEFDSVLRAVGGIDRLIDWDKKAPEIDLMRYMGDSRAKEDKVFDNPKLMKTPVVRNGKQATVGYCPGMWGPGQLKTNIKTQYRAVVLCTSFLRYSFENLSSSVRPILKCVSLGRPCAMAGKKFPVSAVRWISYVPYWLTRSKQSSAFPGKWLTIGFGE